MPKNISIVVGILTNNETMAINFENTLLSYFYNCYLAASSGAKPGIIGVQDILFGFWKIAATWHELARMGSFTPKSLLTKFLGNLESVVNQRYILLQFEKLIELVLEEISDDP